MTFDSRNSEPDVVRLVPTVAAALLNRARVLADRFKFEAGPSEKSNVI